MNKYIIVTIISVLFLASCTQTRSQNEILSIQLRTLTSKETGKREIYVLERRHPRDVFDTLGGYVEVAHFTDGESGRIDLENYELVYNTTNAGTYDISSSIFLNEIDLKKK